MQVVSCPSAILTVLLCKPIVLPTAEAARRCSRRRSRRRGNGGVGATHLFNMAHTDAKAFIPPKKSVSPISSTSQKRRSPLQSALPPSSPSRKRMLSPMHIHMTANHLEHLEKELGFRRNEYAAARWYLSRCAGPVWTPPWMSSSKPCSSTTLVERHERGDRTRREVILYPDGRMLQILQFRRTRACSLAT